MDIFAVALILLAGIASGVAAWLVRAREISLLSQEAQRLDAERKEALSRGDCLSSELAEEKSARARAEVVAERAIELQTELAKEREQLIRIKEENARLQGASAGQEKEHAEKIATLTSLRGEIEKNMQAIAAAALKGNEESFLRLAGQAFETHKQAAATLLEQKEQAIAGLVNPVSAALEAYQKGLSKFENAHAVLSSEVHSVHAETRRLVNALRSSPTTRGRWGEQQFENVIELAGLTAHVDYKSQQTIEADDGRVRPDFVIRLPGERFLVVDVKTPLTAYLDASEALDDEARDVNLRRHSQQVRTHMKQLGSKRYWEALRPLTPDFVVMFIPGENFYRAAFERDPNLLQDGWKERVLIASPTTLLALAMTVAFDWRREKVAENARHVGELGRELYKRLAIMGNHVTKLGNTIRLSVEHYSRFVGSLEGSVMPQARRFRELDVEGTQDALPELKPIEILPRELRTGADLLLTPAEIIPVVAADPPVAAE